MAVIAFYNIVGERALKETRTVTSFDDEVIPPGSYAFMEFYCNDPACDCRRVIIQVWRQDTKAKVWATLTFGWETPAYYAKWSGSNTEAGAMASATLEPLSPQTEFAPALLQMFKDLMLTDDVYIERLKRHYQEAAPRHAGGKLGRPRYKQRKR